MGAKGGANTSTTSTNQQVVTVTAGGDVGLTGDDFVTVTTGLLGAGVNLFQSISNQNIEFVRTTNKTLQLLTERADSANDIKKYMILGFIILGVVIAIR